MLQVRAQLLQLGDQGWILTVKTSRVLLYDTSESKVPFFAHKLLYRVVADYPGD